MLYYLLIVLFLFITMFSVLAIFINIVIEVMSLCRLQENMVYSSRLIIIGYRDPLLLYLHYCVIVLLCYCVTVLLFYCSASFLMCYCVMYY